MWARIDAFLMNIRHVWKFTLPTHLGAVAALAYAVYTGQLLALLGVAAAAWALLSIGVEVGNHRLFSHRAFETHRAWQVVLAVLGTLAAQGSIIFWVAVHRGFHHPHADTEKDPHSPIAHGYWHAYLGWLIGYDRSMSFRSAANLLRDPVVMWLHKHFYRFLVACMLVLFVLGGPILLGGYLLGNVVCTQQNFLVNILCHHPRLGYRSFETKCQSRNVTWLSILSWGLSLHNNHHADPGNPVLSKRPGEIDISSWVIRLLQTRSQVSEPAA
jgi:fatty-acid desaturase